MKLGRRGRRRTRSFRLTREGKSFVLVTLGVGVAAVNTGNNLLYLVLGLMLSLLLVSGVLSDLALWRVRARRVLPRRLFAGTPCRVEVVLENDKRWVPSFSLEVEDVVEGGENPTRSYFLKVAPRSRDSVFYAYAPPRRGRLRFTHLRLVTRYPFGLIEKGQRLAVEDEAVVYPELRPMSLPAARRAHEHGSKLAQRHRGGDEFAGLREHLLGDNARDIHWRRSASWGRLVSRDREQERGAQLWLTLDHATHDPSSESYARALDAAVSEVASLASASLALGRSASLVTRGAAALTVQPGQPPDPLLRFLALLEPIASEGAPAMNTPPGAHVVRVEDAKLPAPTVEARG